ncbi:hypothetical protein ACGFNP_41085 [Nonomuraea sp. NPDC049269]|uniref:hypothetical protein n=1 Tax=Nonomuraea sp. NPDC049269 TaxID=3364349 RepID=UPI00371BE84C
MAASAAVSAVVVTSVTLSVTLLLRPPGGDPSRATNPLADGATSSPVTEPQGNQAQGSSTRSPTSSPTEPSPSPAKRRPGGQRGTLLRRLPNLRLAVPLEEIRFRNDMSIYGVHELPVTWE